MDPLRLIFRVSVILAGILLISCIDSHEEVWLEADGSGRAELRFSVPARAAILHGGENGIRAAIGEFLENTPQLKNTSSSVVVEGGRMKVKAAASFDSALDLATIPAAASLEALPGSADGLAGTVDLRVEGRRFELARTINARRSLPGSLFMPASQMKGRNLVYVLHLPKPAIESNATRTENEGRTLVWEYPLATAVKAPFTIRFKAEVPLPRWLLASVGGSLVLLVALAAIAARNLRAKSRNRALSAA